MRLLVVLMPLVGSLLLALGCGFSVEQDTKSGGGTGSGNFDTRFDAAKAMPAGYSRNATLETLALDAAKAGDAEMVNKCLAEIGSLLRDGAAYRAALSLGKAGKEAAANEVAKSIKDQSKKEEALKKIAVGNFNW
jgi:hypothetical protein